MMGMFIRCFLLLIMVYSLAMSAQTPIAYYPMNGNANDSSGNDYHGQLIGGVNPILDRHGQPCGALAFNGVDGFIEVPNKRGLSAISNSFTFCFWFRLNVNQINNDVKNLTILCKGNTSDETAYMPQYRFQLFQFKQQSTISINTGLTVLDPDYVHHQLPIGKWVFMAVTYSGSLATIYLNDNKIWSSSYKAHLKKNSSPLYIGKDQPGNTEFFEGALDDLMIFDQVLSHKQIEIIRLQGSHLSNERQLKCPDDTIIFLPENTCKVLLDIEEPNISTYCGINKARQMLGPTIRDSIGIGRHQFAYIAEFGGIKKSCLFTVSVRDKTPPLIICPDNIIVQAAKDTVISYNKPSAMDNCGVRDIIKQSRLAENDIFPIGASTVSYLAVDHAGNTASCEFRIDILNRVNHTSRNYLTSIDSIIDDQIDEQFRLKVDSCLVTLHLYDGQKEDNDTISFFVNDSCFVSKRMIKNKQNGLIELVLTLDNLNENIFVSKAWNIGKISPNTLTVDIYSGDVRGYNKEELKKQLITTKIIHSRPGSAGCAILSCN